jgi:hypothetical protein
VVAVGGQVKLQWDPPKPAWLGQQLAPWFAANDYLGNQARLLAPDECIVEGNLALDRKAWEAGGKFLGMEQFGSQNMAAGEILYLLVQLRKRAGKLAYAPQAVAVHHVHPGTRQRILQRAYWQGVSDGIFDFLVYRRSWISTTAHIIRDLAATIVLYGFACIGFLRADQARGMYHLARFSRRVGLILSEMRLTGDWSRIRSWASAHPLIS